VATTLGKHAEVLIEVYVTNLKESLFQTQTNIQFFYVHISLHHKSIYLEDQRDAVLSSLYFVILPSHSTYFGCLEQPTSGVHKL
jgi:hypothetical protein